MIFLEFFGIIFYVIIIIKENFPQSKSLLSLEITIGTLRKMISFTFDALIYFGERAYSLCLWFRLFMYSDYVCELLWKGKFQFHRLGSKNILAIIIFPCKKKYQ